MKDSAVGAVPITELKFRMSCCHWGGRLAIPFSSVKRVDIADRIWYAYTHTIF